MDDVMKRIKELVNIIVEANEAYYGDGEEIMSNKEYDALYDELVQLEQESGIVLSNSPTKKVGFAVNTKLPKEEHPKPMLSLSKTKLIEDLEDFVQDNETILSWKLDGLTIVLTYSNGKLVKGLTRGNGTVGEVVTDNVKQFKNVPLSISYKGDMVVRGEALIKYSDFNKLNEGLPLEEQYKNPRNLCSGSVRQLESKITAERNVYFYAFQLVSAEEIDFQNKKVNMFNFLKEQGFDVVGHTIMKNKDDVRKTVLEYKEKISTNDIPSDGLVLTYNDINYSKSLGTTLKSPRDSIAFKWMDEEKETKLIDVEWSASRTGLINPVAVFEPIEIEGTTVSRASVHNVSILKDLQLGKGDIIKVFKANMIIPQISENVTCSNSIEIPTSCPVCHGDVEIKKYNDSEMLYCINENCPAKLLKSMEHFVSRNAMNIDGLSIATLQKFIDEGFLNDVVDLYDLQKYKEKIINLDGFGEKSYENLIDSINNSKNIKLPNFINALGIQNVGIASAKLLAKQFKTIDNIINADEESLKEIEGFGEIVAKNIVEYFNDDKLKERTLKLKSLVNIEEIEEAKNSNITNLTFVITGDVHHFANRDELKEKIDSLGGKTSSSVSSKTDYLINNDILSNSSKNKKAKELGIKIITEDEFLKIIEE